MAKFETPESKRLRYVVQASREARTSERLSSSSRFAIDSKKRCRPLSHASMPVVSPLLLRSCTTDQAPSFLAFLWRRPGAHVRVRDLPQYGPTTFIFGPVPETCPSASHLCLVCFAKAGRQQCAGSVDSCCPIGPETSRKPLRFANLLQAVRDNIPPWWP